MTDTSKLMPGPELDAIIAEILGWKPERLCMDDPENPSPCLDGTGEEDDCLHLCTGQTFATCDCCQLSPTPQYSTLPTANADVKRWLVEHVPTHSDIVSWFNLPMLSHGTPRYEVRYEPYLSRWDAGYYCSVWSEQYTLQREGAFTEETNSDPIAAEMLAVCRFAVRVSRELKKVESQK